MDKKMDHLKIKVAIANRMYPLTIPRKDEEAVRKAAKKIEESLKAYESSYAVRDKQDLIAMAALQFAIQVQNSEGKTLVNEDELKIGLMHLEEAVNALESE
ncbi:MAG: cell division protein ZapA [Flavobacteriales bacterium]|jgi:cell division protein ZapA